MGIKARRWEQGTNGYVRTGEAPRLSLSEAVALAKKLIDGVDRDAKDVAEATMKRCQHALNMAAVWGERGQAADYLALARKELTTMIRWYYNDTEAKVIG